MKKFIVLISISIYFNNLTYSQPAIQWEKSFGGTDFDVATSIQQTVDSGYIVAGHSNSDDGDVTEHFGLNSNDDCWIIKLDYSGAIQWQKTLGGSKTDLIYSIQQTSDGGYIFAGESYSNDSDVTINHGGSDYWIVKLNNLGDIQFQKSFGGSLNDIPKSIQQTVDKGYIVAGYSNSRNGDILAPQGGNDCWILKLDSSGILQWQKSLGGTAGDYAYSIKQTSDEGYIIAGTTESNDGDVIGHHGIGRDFWIIKLENNGDLQWQKSLGGTNYEEAASIQLTSDGGFIVAGYSNSNDGNVTGHNGSITTIDYWIVKLNKTGAIQWQKSFGGGGNDRANFIQQTTDLGYAVVGYSSSNDSTVIGNHGRFDYWFLKLNNTGNIQWQMSLGGTIDDEAICFQQTNDDGYIIAGFSNSTDGDINGNHGSNDYWIVKLNSFVNVNEIQNSIVDFQISPNPLTNETIISFNNTSSDNTIIKIYDIAGCLTKDLSSKILNSLQNEIIWDATNDEGCKVCSGIYIVSIQADKYYETKKIQVFKND